MLSVQIPNNNIPEREYVIKTLFDFLGLPYTIITNNSKSYYSILFNECALFIQDSFFSCYPEALSYLNADALPEKIVFAKNEFAIENNIPIIYGTDELYITENKIICGIDIFASSFFMLTRWEEYIIKTRDMHNRFPGSVSIAYVNNFLHRPVVNEYMEMLWKMLQKLGYKGEREQRNFELVLTHDIDFLGYPISIRTILGDILKRRNLNLAQKHLRYMFVSDPYDTFDFLMTKSEKLGLKSHFYFMSSDSKLMYDTSYYLKSKLFSSKINEIKKRGHIIGFHPGYYTFDNLERWLSEKQLLEKAVQQETVEGRQHYLRIDVTKTFNIWDKNNMEIDSTLGFADKEGFRCGTGNIFPIFDFLERKQLILKERPLIIMDSTLKKYQQYSQEQAIELIQYYVAIGKKYNTNITLLFHNTVFCEEWEEYRSIYIKILNK